MFCTKCGNMLRDNDAFCSACGARNMQQNTNGYNNQQVFNNQAVDVNNQYTAQESQPVEQDNQYAAQEGKSAEQEIPNTIQDSQEVEQENQHIEQDDTPIENQPDNKNVGQADNQHTNQYNGQYNNQYESQNVNAEQFNNQYANQYNGQYNNQYAGANANAGQFNNQYANQYNGQYNNQYVGPNANMGQFNNQYANQYNGQYNNQYANPNANAGQFNNQYANQYNGQYNNQYAGANANAGQFNNQYANQYNGQYNNQYAGQGNVQFNNGQYVGQLQQGMAWFKFLIYFSLFAGVVLSVISAIMYFTGLIYGEDGYNYADLVYEAFPELKAINITMGIGAIIIAILALVTRFSLASYKKKGPVLLYVMYVTEIALNLFHIIAVNNILPEYAFDETYLLRIIVLIVGKPIILYLNIVYFRKRKHLFVN